MGKRVDDLRIIGNKHLGQDFFILEVSADDIINDFKPGQFVQVKAEGSPETFLRRPVSIYDVDYEKKAFSLFIQIVGKGTAALSILNQGDSVNLIYPLGNHFSMPDEEKKILLIGGGVGIAPMLFLGKHLKSKGYNPDMLLGFRSSDRIFEIEEFTKVGKVYITTEDGSRGEKGYVTQHSILKDERYERIYCCGPELMMKAVASYCNKNNIFCEVSLENLMACGIGICLCCIAETVRGNLCTCTDGPVFNTKELKW
jgi:dihydroorotate dehydrogenase electron transfer subunit